MRARGRRVSALRSLISTRSSTVTGMMRIKTLRTSVRTRVVLK